MLTFSKSNSLCTECIKSSGRGQQTERSALLPFWVYGKAVCMAVAAAIGVTVGFAFLRSAVRRAAMRSGRRKK